MGISWAEPIAKNVLVIAQLTTVEMSSLLARRQRESSFSLENALSLLAQFMFHVENQYLVMPAVDEVYSRARQLIFLHQLRTLDALQLASAYDGGNERPKRCSADAIWSSVAPG
jgi:predicted nucleic acid-binding protein